MVMVWRPVELPQLTGTEYLECRWGGVGGMGGGIVKGWKRRVEGE